MPKISALTSLAQASVDTAADVLPIVDATAPATTKNVTVQAMVNAGLATLTTLPSGIVNASLNSITPAGGTLGITGDASASVVTASSRVVTDEINARTATRVSINNAYGTSLATFDHSTGLSSFNFGAAVTGVQTITANSASPALTVANNGAGGGVALTDGTANGVPYLNGSKVLTTGSALTFNGTNLLIGQTSNPNGVRLALGGSVVAGLPAVQNAAFRGFKFGITDVAGDFGSVQMNIDTGEVRNTAGYGGYGGFHTWHANGSQIGAWDSAGLSVTGSISATQTIRAEGTTPLASGAGLELFYNAATPLAGVEAYDRTGGVPLPLALSGSSVKLVASAGIYNINNIPTSSAGLSAGDLWSDGGTIKIV